MREPENFSSELIAPKEPAAVILGGYVNGYGIIRELHDSAVRNIWLLDDKNSIGGYSSLLTGFVKVDCHIASLATEINKLLKRYSKLIFYPTSDVHLEILSRLSKQFREHCFFPFNMENLEQSLDKYVQYSYCNQIGIPFPTSSAINSVSDLDKLLGLSFPLILKPRKRRPAESFVFRNIQINNESDVNHHKDNLIHLLKNGIQFVASDIIPGDDSTIYAYTAYRARSGEIINEWIGKKLTQFPDCFGVFSSARNEAPEIIRQYGRALIQAMDLHGIVQPEFKYDSRDGDYKLMEINLRSMMWHRLGNLSGVKIQYTQWRDGLGLPPLVQDQDLKTRIHFIYMQHEILNLFGRKGYISKFLYNLLRCDKRYFAIANIRDPLPFIIDFSVLLKALIARCLKILRVR